MRRAPLQQRSVERVNQMLDVAAALLDEGGYDALSTRAVAARTGLPIGSIYRFFQDKRALADALARRNLDSFLGRIAARLAARLAGREPPGLSWAQVVDLVVDEYLDMKATVPGFAVLDFGANAEVADALAALLGVTPAPRARRALLLAVETADALLRTHHADPEMVEETKEMLRSYLARRLA
ncbi:TetR/AcrR family transcriptional regulator [Nonomuraea sp. NPDC050310]|uniref:TetR/AcrR family transcriptional regulator n=1 Tax=unclassified Nonomuraea TaxID=2593643 RepID=UPI0033D03CE2